MLARHERTTAKTTTQQANGGDGLSKPQPGSGTDLGGQFDERQVEHPVGDDRPGTAACDLGGYVGGDISGGQATKDPVGERHHRIDVGTRDRAEGQDAGDESDRGGRGVLEQLQPDVARGEALGGDPGADDDCREERRAQELDKRSPPQGRAGRLGASGGRQRLSNSG